MSVPHILRFLVFVALLVYIILFYKTESIEYSSEQMLNKTFFIQVNPGDTIKTADDNGWYQGCHLNPTVPNEPWLYTCEVLTGYMEMIITAARPGPWYSMSFPKEDSQYTYEIGSWGAKYAFKFAESNFYGKPETEVYSQLIEDSGTPGLTLLYINLMWKKKVQVTYTYQWKNLAYSGVILFIGLLELVILFGGGGYFRYKKRKIKRAKQRAYMRLGTESFIPISDTEEDIPPSITESEPSKE